jgi:3-dehydroquinate synthase
MRNLILTGFMGTGKTTVGRILAERSGLEFVDLDREIERRAGCSIAEFWSRHQEPAFRDLEAQTFAEVMNGSSRSVSGGAARIVATGGGTLVFERNRSRLQEQDVVVCLICETDRLEARLEGERHVRPLIASLRPDDVADYLDARLERRRPVYDLYRQVDTTKLSPRQVAGEIERMADLSSFSLAFDAGKVSTISFGRGFAGRLGEVLEQHGTGGAVMVVIDEMVNGLRGGRMAIESLGTAPQHDEAEGRQKTSPSRPYTPRVRPTPPTTSTVVLPSGEKHKTLSSVERIYRAAMGAGLDRSSAIVGLGGGVIGDIAGFAAATYMRGIRLVLVPTTLLAQVDAAIGGKVGADFEGIKNLVGAFHPAHLIVIDPDLLATLPDSALADGMAEIVKIATVFSEDLLASVENLSGVRAILEAPSVIRQAAALKVQVVEQDPYERGNRGLLNFGHTVGHGIESASGYRLSHGSAVSAGMVAETRLAVRLGLTGQETLDRLSDLLRRFGLQLHVEGVDADAVWAAMRSDKKRLSGVLRFALPTSLGSGALVEVTADDARAAVELACAPGGRS